MTQATAKLNGTPPSAAAAGPSGPGTGPAVGVGVVAAVHRQSDRWRIVILDNRNGLSLVQATSVDTDSQAAAVVAQYKADRLIRVAPSRQTVARCVPVPVGNAADVGSAIGLLAEAQLPESVPFHRRAAGVVPEQDGPGRAAILTGWQGDSPGDLTEDSSGELAKSWVTPAASLAMLRQGRGETAVYADPDEGAITVLVFGSKSIARVLVENAANPSAFASAVGVVVGETCGAAGVEAPDTPLGQSGVILSIDPGVIAATRATVRGVPDQRSWFEQYGIALGAAMIGVSADPLIQPLASMLSVAPVRRESPPERAVNWLAKRRNAWILLAASVGLVLLGPLAVAWAKLSILESKAVGLGDRNREKTESNRRNALYRQLETSRWPMSKLMGDVSAAIPVGVTAESIRIASDQGLAIQGSADTAELVNTMQANLSATKLLGSVKVNRVESSGARVEFDLTADVINPHTKAVGVEDFAAKPLSVRLHGEGASNTAMPKNVANSREAAATREPRTSSRPERSERAERNAASSSGNGGGGGSGGDRGSERGGGGERGSSRTSEAPTRTAAAPPGEAPPPLTDDQIAKMDKGAATKEWVARKTFPQKNPTVDAGTKSRLEEEVRKLREQMDKAGAAK